MLNADLTTDASPRFGRYVATNGDQIRASVVPASGCHFGVRDAHEDRFVGMYPLSLAPNTIITITRDGDRLFGQLTGQPPFALYAD